MDLDLDPSVTDPRKIVRSLGTDPDRGLSGPEAARRLAADGPNEIRSAAPVPVWRKVLAQFQDPLIYLLLLAVAISVAAWVAEGADGWPVDALVILAIVVLNAVLGYVQQAKAEDAVAALQTMTASMASVIRDGDRVQVPASEVVTGDVLVLGEGDSVAADARLVATATLTVAEAALTGESQPQLKDAATLREPAPLAERLDMVYAGTAVTQGTGRAVVTTTGMGTEMGRIAGLLEATPEEPTPLQREIAWVGRMLGAAVVVIAVVVAGAVLLTNRVDSADDALTVLLLAVSLAVAAVPEGLPAILTVVLSIGVRRMAAHKAIVKKLSSVETLGSASVICSDKTGTLTKNEMTIERVVTPSGETHVTGVGYRPDGRVEHDGAELTDPALRWENVVVLGGGSLAGNAVLRGDGDEWSIQGDPTEAAFLVAERKLGATQAVAGRFTRVAEVPFTSERKLMSSLEADAERGGRIAVVTKGAPDVLLGRCTHIQTGEDVEPLDDRRRAGILADVDRLSAAALRTLAVGYRELDEVAVPQADASIEHGLVYAGMVGIIDPPRPEAAEAIREAHRAGIRVIMITGDHPSTAVRIATDLGIVETSAPGEASDRVLTGPVLSRLSRPELVEAVRRTNVYARVAPQHKLDIVDALQADGHVVAMTGDGVNDAPALKSADIGIAMGTTGTEVTKQAATMILADDNFATIVAAVRQGRDIFANIRKFLRYLLSSNLGEVLTVFLGTVLAGVIGPAGDGDGLVVPLLATQILWVNLLTDSGPALALGVDPEIDDVMARPPRRRSDRVIDARMWTQVVLTGLVMAVVTLLALDLYLPGGMIAGDRSLDNARTAAFTVLVLAQLFNSLNARSDASSAFRRLFANRWLWAAIAASALLQVAVVHLPVLNTAFGTVPLTGSQWLACTALAGIVLVTAELAKLAVRIVAAARS
jgi:magnesium-transporting ATPase (P-type)